MHMHMMVVLNKNLRKKLNKYTQLINHYIMGNKTSDCSYGRVFQVMGMNTLTNDYILGDPFEIGLEFNIRCMVKMCDKREPASMKVTHHMYKDMVQKNRILVCEDHIDQARDNGHLC
jgi:hypothetical protein